jgi:hypothetical protein
MFAVFALVVSSLMSSCLTTRSTMCVRYRCTSYVTSTCRPATNTVLPIVQSSQQVDSINCGFLISLCRVSSISLVAYSCKKHSVLLLQLGYLSSI